VTEVFSGGTNSGLEMAGGKRLVFLHQDLSHPAELYTVRTDGKGLLKLTSFGDDILESIDMGAVDEHVFEGAGGDSVQMFVLFPPGFNHTQKWPLLHLVHGGPHGVFGDYFHPRWNAQVFAAPGYVVAMVNFHGSSSFGQDFADVISGAWGDKPFTDIMKATDYLVETGVVDEDRMAVAGGSYGGYLVSWIGCRTDRFKCIINHAGVFDLVNQFASDYTMGRDRSFGGSPWRDLEGLTRYSPAHNMESYVTPTLVIHGERDYRVPVGQGLEAYGVLKGKGVDAKLIYFPDENHWVLSPQNSIFWYNEFHDWLDRYIGTGASGE
jgi:dipeptidyl aminopeptidase/acylaminoacyl peptidase